MEITYVNQKEFTFGSGTMSDTDDERELVEEFASSKIRSALLLSSSMFVPASSARSPAASNKPTKKAPGCTEELLFPG